MSSCQAAVFWSQVTSKTPETFRLGTRHTCFFGPSQKGEEIIQPTSFPTAGNQLRPQLSRCRLCDDVVVFKGRQEFLRQPSRSELPLAFDLALRQAGRWPGSKLIDCLNRLILLKNIYKEWPSLSRFWSSGSAHGHVPNVWKNASWVPPTQYWILILTSKTASVCVHCWQVQS